MLMKYRITRFLITIFAMILSPLLSAKTEDFYVVNNFPGPLHIELLAHSGYCIFSTKPSVLDVPPGGMAKILVYYNGGVFDPCGYQHSSENFRATAASPNGMPYTLEFQWFKPSRYAPKINFLKNPNSLMSMGTTVETSFAGWAEDDKPCIYFNGQHGRSCKLE